MGNREYREGLYSRNSERNHVRWDFKATSFNGFAIHVLIFIMRRICERPTHLVGHQLLEMTLKQPYTLFCILADERKRNLTVVKGIQAHIIGEAQANINQKLPTKLFDLHFKALLEWIIEEDYPRSGVDVDPRRGFFTREFTFCLRGLWQLELVYTITCTCSECQTLRTLEPPNLAPIQKCHCPWRGRKAISSP